MTNKSDSGHDFWLYLIGGILLWLVLCGGFRCNVKFTSKPRNPLIVQEAE